VRLALLAIACLEVACGDEAPEAHPIYIEVELDGGELDAPCAERQSTFERLSTRDVELTAVKRKDRGWLTSCALPVDGRRERLLLFGLGCSLVGDQPATVGIEALEVGGAHMSWLQLELSAGQRSAIRTFGAGMPVLRDVEMRGSEGRARCWLSGMYIRTTDPEKLWGRRRLVSHDSEYEPNPDRR
jgi:hypothetical protein